MMILDWISSSKYTDLEDSSQEQATFVGSLLGGRHKEKISNSSESLQAVS